MEYNILGRKLSISNGYKNYLNIISYFEEMADKAVKLFTVESIDMFLENDDKNGVDNYIKAFIVEGRDFLAQNGVYTVTDNQIWDDIVHDVEHKYAHSLVDIEVNKALDEIEEMAIREGVRSADDYFLYLVRNLENKVETGCFEDSIRTDIMKICDFCIEYLYENNVIEIELVSQENADKASAIYSNLKRNNIPGEQLYDMILQMLKNDPTEYDYYLMAFERLPEARHEVYKMASFLGFDLFDCAQSTIEDEFELTSITTEEEAFSLMEKLKAEMQEYGIDGCETEFKLKQILLDFDIKARTYDNHLYDTRDMCAKAVADDNCLKNLCGEIEEKSKEQCKALLSEVNDEKYILEIRRKYISLLNDQLNYIDKCYLQQLTGNIAMCSKEDCIAVKFEIDDYDAAKEVKTPFINKVNNKILEIDKEFLQQLLLNLSELNEDECNDIKVKITQYDASEDVKIPYLSKIDKRVYEIWDAEDFGLFEEIYTQTRPSDFVKMEENSALIEQKGRTATKELFVKAIRTLTVSFVEEAAKYALGKDGGLLSSIASIGKKGTYEILTLNGRVMHPAILNAMEDIKSKRSSSIFSTLGFKKSKSMQPSPDGKMKFCSNCGKQISADSNFCSYCGNKN